MFELAGGRANYTYDKALASVRAYVCETAVLCPKPGYSDVFDPADVPRFAYRTYDCVPASPGPGPSDLDVLVVAGLDLRVDAKTFVRLRSFADRAATPLEAGASAAVRFPEAHRGRSARRAC